MTIFRLITLLTVLLLPSKVLAVVALDAVSTPTAGTGDLSWTHTPTGTPKGVLVLIATGNGGTSSIDDVTTVTYGGSSLSEVTDSPVLSDAGYLRGHSQHIFFLGSSIPTGAQTVVVSDNNSDNLDKDAICVTVTAGGDTSVVDTAAITGADTSANPGVTLSLGGETCFAAVVWGNDAPAASSVSPLSGWTDRMEIDYGNHIGGAYTYDTVGSTDVTAGITWVGGDQTRLIGIAIKDDGGASGFVNPLTGAIPGRAGFDPIGL